MRGRVLRCSVLVLRGRATTVCPSASLLLSLLQLLQLLLLRKVDIDNRVCS